MTRLPLSALAASALTFGASAIAFAQAPVVQAPPGPTHHTDGSLTVDGVHYNSASEWHHSDAFIEEGRRCFTPEAPEIVAAFSPTDCSFSQTSIEGDYDPAAGETYVIPVVFHVLTNGSQGLLDMSLLTSQIDILNEDFQALAGTPGAPGTDAKIAFELATMDPDGNPTNGVEIHDGFFNNPNAADQFAWNPSSYLNIYTANIGALGYVRGFPQQIAGQSADGVWLLYTSVGRNSPGGGQFNQGRTGTHEVGHYLGLFHTFQGGCGTGYTAGDLINDTNPESSPSSGCPAGQTSCGGQPVPYENYMDYSDDRCLNNFTPEQVNRMRCSIAHYRGNLTNAVPLAAFEFTKPDDFSFVFVDTSTDSDGSVVSWQWDFGDGTTSTEQNPSHTYAEYGAYDVRLSVTDDRGVVGTTVQTVAANIAPNADFDFFNNEVNVQFEDKSSDENGTVVAWEWDFGDGTTGESQNPVHVYPEIGKYTVTMTVTDDLGTRTTVTKEIDLEGGGCGCQTSGGEMPWGNIALFGLAFALIGWRRRRK